MYNLDKLAFSKDFREITDLRIPPVSIFMLNNKICMYEFTDNGVFVVDLNTRKHIYNFYGHHGEEDYVDKLVEVLQKAILLESRIYYHVTSKNSLICINPLIIDRKYRWSLAPRDFNFYRFNTKNNEFYDVDKHRGFLIKALKNYYLVDHPNIPTNNSYFGKEGKYFIFNNFIFYNHTIIGELNNYNQVKIYPKFKPLFIGDFSENYS